MEAKRRRINAMAGLGKVSHTSLVKIMAAIRAEPDLVDAIKDRNDIDRAVNSIMRTVGQVDELPLSEAAGTFTWHHASPQKILKYLADESAPFAALLGETHMRHQAQWHVVLYTDEITPGNVLRPDNARKIWAFYFSFREFGASILCKEEAWIPLAVLRSTVAKNVKGQLSCATRHLLRRLFAEDDGLSTGVILNVICAGRREQVIICAKLGNIVADEAALKAIFSSKGAAGLLPCFKCRNVVSQADLAASDASRYLVDMQAIDTSKFDLASNEDYWEKTDILTQRHNVPPKYRFDELQKALGLTYNPFGILADIELREFVQPVDTHTYDSMHISFSNGIGQDEIGLMLDSIKPLGIRWEHVREYMDAAWQWPKIYKAGSAPAVFSAAREPSGDQNFRASASEMLMIYPLLRHFVITVVAPTHKVDAEVNSFLAMCRCFDTLQDAKKFKCEPERLSREISEFRAAHLRVHGEMKPKGHFLAHIPSQMRRDGLLLDCFTHERKNKDIKASCNWIDKTTNFERSGLAQSIVSHMRMILKPGCFGDTLKGKMIPFPALAEAEGGTEALVAPAVVWRSATFSEGDIVLVNGNHDRAVKVIACASVDLRLYLFVQELVCVAKVNDWAWEYNIVRPLAQIIELRGDLKVKPTSCWTVQQNGHILVLL